MRTMGYRAPSQRCQLSTQKLYDSLIGEVENVNGVMPREHFVGLREAFLPITAAEFIIRVYEHSHFMRCQTFLNLMRYYQ